MMYMRRENHRAWLAKERNRLSIHLHCVQYSIVMCGYLMPAPTSIDELMLVVLSGDGELYGVQ